MNNYRNTADFVLWMAFVIVLLGALAYFTGSAGAASVGEYPNPYYIVCDDPLLTNVTLANACGQGNSQAVAQSGAESLPVPNSGTVVPTVDIQPTQTIIDDGGETVPDQPADDAPACSNGNPGNHKCNGNAGEDPNGRGTMDDDSADGNGEHGNQGKGGKKDK